jgi:hypothetical protein
VLFPVECLRCGENHELVRSPWRRLQSGHCPRCGYVGWAEAADLDELTRRRLRERPPESRRLDVEAPRLARPA